MSQVVTQTRTKLFALVGALVLAFACAAIAAPSSAYAAYNSNCVINAYAQNKALWDEDLTDDENYAELYYATDSSGTLPLADQYIYATIRFGSSLSGSVSVVEMTSYLQHNITIFQNTTSTTGLAIDSSAYPRTVSNVDFSDDGYTVTFVIGPRTDGVDTANYCAKLVLAANNDTSEGAYGNTVIYNAMNSASGETLIRSGLSIAQTGSTTATVDGVTITDSKTFTVNQRSMNRMMIHILASEGTGSTASALFQGTTGVNGGCLVIHAHQSPTYMTADYAGFIGTAANAATQVGTGGYSFVVSGNTITVSRTVGGVAQDVSNFYLQVYDGLYLNTYGYDVGSITEPIIG